MKPKRKATKGSVKRFFKKRSPLVRSASRIIKQLYGSNEERLGQFEMIEQSEAFQRKYPGLLGKDVAAIVRLQLSTF